MNDGPGKITQCENFNAEMCFLEGFLKTDKLFCKSMENVELR